MDCFQRVYRGLNFESKTILKPKRRFMLGTMATTSAIVLSVSSAGTASAALPLPMAGGINDPSCQLTPAHPEPVILLHGLGARFKDAALYFGKLAPALAEEGYCVYFFNWGRLPTPSFPIGGADLIGSAHEVATKIQVIARQTGTTHVALVGHSIGGIVARYAANLLLPSGMVDKVILLDGVTHSIPANFLYRFIGRVAPAVTQASTRTAQVWKNLNGSGKTKPGIAYSTMISTTASPMAASYQLADEPGVTNTELQKMCGNDMSGHIRMLRSKPVLQWIRNQLNPDNPRPINCFE
jgi:pimeloyl-ACP methyl ester carboxylesterase